MKENAEASVNKMILTCYALEKRNPKRGSKWQKI